MSPLPPCDHDECPPTRCKRKQKGRTKREWKAYAIVSKGTKTLLQITKPTAYPGEEIIPVIVKEL